MQLHCSVTVSLQARLACWLRREKAARTGIACSGWRPPRSIALLPGRRPRPLHHPRGRSAPRSPRRPGTQRSRRLPVPWLECAGCTLRACTTARHCCHGLKVCWPPRFLAAPGRTARQPQRVSQLGLQGLHRGRGVQGEFGAVPLWSGGGHLCTSDACQLSPPCWP